VDFHTKTKKFLIYTLARTPYAQAIWQIAPAKHSKPMIEKALLGTRQTQIAEMAAKVKKSD